jgi:hypothetical protein
MSLKEKVSWLVESKDIVKPYDFPKGELDSKTWILQNLIENGAPNAPNHYTINEYLRKSHGMTKKAKLPHPEMERAIKEIDEKLGEISSTNHKGGKLHRFLLNSKAKYEPGKTYVNHGYMHTTTSPKHFEGTHEGISDEGKITHHFHISVPPKHPVAHIKSWNHEHVLARGSKFHVTKVEHKDGVQHVHANIVPDKVST